MSTTGSEIFCTLKANMCVNELCVILQILKVPFWLVFEVQKKMWNPRNWMWCSENDGKIFLKTHKTSKTSWCKERCCKKIKTTIFWHEKWKFMFSRNVNFQHTPRKSWRTITCFASIFGIFWKYMHHIMLFRLSKFRWSTTHITKKPRVFSQWYRKNWRRKK